MQVLSDIFGRVRDDIYNKLVIWGCGFDTGNNKGDFIHGMVTVIGCSKSLSVWRGYRHTTGISFPKYLIWSLWWKNLVTAWRS